jgi:hypothetical protein
MLLSTFAYRYKTLGHIYFFFLPLFMQASPWHAWIYAGPGGRQGFLQAGLAACGPLLMIRIGKMLKIGEIAWFPIVTTVELST